MITLRHKKSTLRAAYDKNNLFCKKFLKFDPQYILQKKISKKKKQKRSKNKKNISKNKKIMIKTEIYFHYVHKRISMFKKIYY